MHTIGRCSLDDYATKQLALGVRDLRLRTGRSRSRFHHDEPRAAGAAPAGGIRAAPGWARTPASVALPAGIGLAIGAFTAKALAPQLLALGLAMCALYRPLTGNAER
jgi:hypothetical protein